MNGLRIVLAASLIVGLVFASVQGSSGQVLIGSCAQAQVPLPHGRELDEEELLTVEGEIAFLLALLIWGAATATAGAGAAAIHENWFDEDYGIDRDDWRNIGSGAVSEAIFGLSGGMVSRYVPI